jgi:PAS domain S-box-containing protein
MVSSPMFPSREVLLGALQAVGGHLAILTGADLRHAFVNAGYQRLAPGTPMIGRPFREVFPEASASGAEAKLRRVLETGDACHLGMGDATRLTAGEGEEPSLVLFAADSADRLRAAESAERSERLERERRLLEIFLEEMPARLAMFDREMRYVAATPPWIEDYHPGMSDVVGQSHYELLPDLPERYREAHRRSLAGETDGAEQDPQPSPDGGTVYRKWETRPWYEQDGSAGGIVIACEDVTARVRYEATIAAERERLRSFIMHVPVAVAVFEGPELRYAMVNDALTRMFPDRNRIGRPFLEVYPELRGQPAAEALLDAYRTGKPHTYVEKRMPLPGSDGRLDERYFTASFQPLGDADGRVTGIVAALSDVTDQVRARHALEDSVRFAEQFIAILGHDLRNPLNAIGMAAKLMHRKACENGETKLAERIMSSTGRMTNMVAQLLDLTRSRLAGGIVIERRLVDLDGVVSGVVDELRAVHPTREVRCAVSPGVLGDWDAGRLAQVVSNLVSNAIQHGDPSQPVDVQVTTTDGYAVLAIHSFGPPIPADLLPVLFDPYRRGETRGAKSEGLGLGLYICEQLVVAHGGRIEVASSQDRGTTFCVRLPRKAIAQTEKVA